MMSLSALTASFLAVLARPEAEVRLLRKRNEKLERSQVLLMEHIEVLSDELRVARLRLAEERDVTRRLTDAVSQHYAQQAYAQFAQQVYAQNLQNLQPYAQLGQQYAQNLLHQQGQGQQYAQAQAGTYLDCTCVPGRSAALRG
jgi:Na+-transporting NADH:ubiquinone oxidoreductase subunit NqrC